MMVLEKVPCPRVVAGGLARRTRSGGGRLSNSAVIQQAAPCPRGVGDGTITAFYQTRFPTDAFLIEELPVFMLLGFLTFTVFMAILVGILTYPQGFGRFIAGKLTFRETMADFFNNCTWYTNDTSKRCPDQLLQHWTGNGEVNIFTSLVSYYLVYFLLVAVCISINVPAGVFVPSFIIGAAGGRLVGEIMVVLFPEGMRGPDGPLIYPGLYAVVGGSTSCSVSGAAAYTGAVTHTLSVAVIICELTGQLAPILPVLVSLSAVRK
ncbi:unnamed protein product [Heligmosomoides polygyrus]|uniref:Chloride channel protein n=1 Tax=Heligmosomoides polygyrus TaxID=6339 RepID=A0A3P8BRT5_HELPZ|nr:unnamed protein product [Heligmosomoides polygyrus]